MSLINQMLRDLQQRQNTRPAAAAPAPARRPRRSRRRTSLGNLLGTAPPLFWVGICGVAGIVLIWGLSSWLSEVFGPGSAGPVAKPPAEMVAIANAPRPAATTVPPPAKRRAPPVPTAVPPPPPPLAYGSAEPPGIAAPPAVAPSPQPAPPQEPQVAAGYGSATTVFSDNPVLVLTPPAPPRATAPATGARKGGAGPASAAPAAPHIPGVAVHPPGRLHPDLLPGAVNVTNLALQKAAREAAATPPVVTPYGQAEAAYRQGRKAYESNRSEASIPALRRALGYYPGHLLARELLADQLEMTGHGDEALALLQQGLAIAPDYAPFRMRAARMLLGRGDAAGATQTLIGNGLPRVEDDPELHLMLASIYLRLGENFLAAQTYRNLLVHDPRAGRLWLGLGDALAADGQPLEARKAYRRALAAGGLNREESARARTGAAQL